MRTNDTGMGVTRRQCALGAAAICAGIPALSGFWSVTEAGARSSVDLSGSGSVTVDDEGGAYGAAKRTAYFEPFQAATGIKVIPAAGAGSAKLRAGIMVGAPGYDVYVMSGGRMETFAREGLLEHIDYRWFDPGDQAAFSPVKAHKYGAPALFYSLVLAYDSRKFESSPPKTWADFWNTSSHPGSRTLAPGAWGAAGGTFEVALLADGVPPDRLYPLDLDRAFRSLDRIRPAITRFWQSGAEPVQLLIDGQVASATAWNGRVADVQTKGASIGNSWEQAILQYDYWVVPKGVKNVQNAMKFIAFACQARQQARFAELITYGPTNTRAYEFIDPKRAAILPTSPALREKQVLQDYAWWNAEAAPGKTNERVAIERWEKWITSSR